MKDKFEIINLELKTLTRHETSSLDQIKMTKIRLEFDQTNLTTTNLNIGTYPAGSYETASKIKLYCLLYHVTINSHRHVASIHLGMYLPGPIADLKMGSRSQLD